MKEFVGERIYLKQSYLMHAFFPIHLKEGQGYLASLVSSRYVERNYLCVSSFYFTAANQANSQ